MLKKNDFVEYVIHDVLKELSGVTARFMFGAYGLSKSGKLFAIIMNDIVYFKVDETNRKDYEKAGSQQFEYPSKNGPMKMNYWNVPEEVMENPKQAAAWAMKSIEIKKKSKS